MVDISADDYALPIDVLAEEESVKTDRNTCTGTSLRFVNDKYEYVSRYFELKHKDVHADFNVLVLFGKTFVYHCTHEVTETKKRELFTPLFKNFPLAENYTVQWLDEVKTPLLMPGWPKKHVESFTNPV